MTPRRPPKDESEFARAMREVQRTPGGSRRTPAPSPEQRRSSAAAPSFNYPHPDEPLLAFAAGLNRAQWRALRRGEFAAETVIDLHGSTEAQARSRVRREILAARASDLRCVRIVHGKGSRSADRPVLKRALPGWLTSPPLAVEILAFAPAQPGEGGGGATLVLLRRGRVADP